jgi:Flp pilus assembly protein TadG
MKKSMDKILRVKNLFYQSGESGQSNESGQATVFMAFFMGIVMLGFLALAIDIGYMFHEKRMAQSAADAAAVAAAEEDSYSGDSSNAQSAANAVATLNGFNTSAASNPATVKLTSLTTGSYPSTSTTKPTAWVQAVVTEPVPTLFLGVFSKGMSTMTVSASGTAAVGASSPTCVCLEGSTGMDLNLSNNAKLNAAACGITVDSSSSNAVGVVGSGSLCPLSIGSISTNWDTSSNINNNGSVCTTAKVVQGISAACSPGMPAAPSYTASSCTADPISHFQGGATYSVGPGSTYSVTQNSTLTCYTSLSIGSNGDTVTLNPGIYVISGGSLHFLSGTMKGGNGVFFYLTNGASLTIDNGANVNLVAGGAAESSGTIAPSTGTAYNNILVYQDSSDSTAMSVQGGSSAYLNGGIYAPAAAMTLGNGSGTTVDSAIVAKSLTMNGGGTLNATSATNLGTLNLSSSKLAQ